MEPHGGYSESFAAYQRRLIWTQCAVTTDAQAETPEQAMRVDLFDAAQSLLSNGSGKLQLADIEWIAREYQPVKQENPPRIFLQLRKHVDLLVVRELEQVIHGMHAHVAEDMRLLDEWQNGVINSGCRMRRVHLCRAYFVRGEHCACPMSQNSLEFWMLARRRQLYNETAKDVLFPSDPPSLQQHMTAACAIQMEMLRASKVPFAHPDAPILQPIMHDDGDDEKEQARHDDGDDEKEQARLNDVD
jgi:hypothetical protein